MRLRRLLRKTIALRDHRFPHAGADEPVLGGRPSD